MANKKRKVSADPDAQSDAEPVNKKQKVHIAALPPSKQSVTNVTSSIEPPPPNPKAQQNNTSMQSSSLDHSSALINAQVYRKRKKQIRKLVPPRPWPSVFPSDNATGPRSSHTAGKNYICLTRKTNLGSYMRRCKDLILNDGYSSIHLSAMGAAIPHLMQLVCALPGILTFSRDKIQVEMTTGTVEVQDEVTPDDAEEDIAYQTRSKSTLTVVLTVDGNVGRVMSKKRRKLNAEASGKRKHERHSIQKRAVVLKEPDQEDLMDMV